MVRRDPAVSSSKRERGSAARRRRWWTAAAKRGHNCTDELGRYARRKCTVRSQSIVILVLRQDCARSPSRDRNSVVRSARVDSEVGLLGGTGSG